MEDGNMKFFISSTFLDLRNIRNITLNMLKDLTCGRTGHITAMEFFDANTASSTDVCLKEIQTADLVIGIYGYRYGSISSTDPEHRSMTEIEFDEAISQNIPILAFVADDIDTYAEDLQKQFIKTKVYKLSGTCARFSLTNAVEFANRLNGSLKQYFGTLDGYEYHSIWDEIQDLKKKLTIDDSNPHLIPFADNEELEAIKQVEESSKYISAVVNDLNTANDIVHPLAYDYEYPEYDTETIRKREQETLDNINKNPDLFLRNWEVLNLFLPNHVRAIQLSIYYLKLCYAQNKLLTENWNENLRQEILSIKHSYIDFIEQKSFLND